MKKRRGVEELDGGGGGQRVAEERLAVPGSLLLRSSALDGPRTSRQRSPMSAPRWVSSAWVWDTPGHMRALKDARERVVVVGRERKMWACGRGRTREDIWACGRRPLHLGRLPPPVSTSCRMTDTLLTPSVGTLPASPQPPASPGERWCHLEWAWALQGRLEHHLPPSLSPRA